MGPIVEFDPSNRIIPFPNNLLIDPMTGLVNLPAQCNESATAKATREQVLNKLDGFGTEIGPNLTAIKTRGPDAVLTNVLDPSREVNPLFVNYVAVTTDGRTITGLISAESAASITLKRAEGVTDTVLRVDLEELESTGLSIMPEGLEKQLDKQTLADVIAYLMQVQ